VTTVFVRDDDLGKPFAPLDRFHALFVDREIPVAYQVVPAFLDDETAAQAVGYQRSAPHLVELHQHGNRHEQELDGVHLWSEFAGDASEADQRAAITDGRDRLAAMLGESFDPRVFTPPAHKYGPTTLRVLDELGVRVLSCGVHTSTAARAVYAAGRVLRRVRVGNRTISHHGRSLPGTGIRERSCALDIDQDGNGNRMNRTADELASQFAAARRHLAVVGLMFHHEGYDDPTKFDHVERFLDGLLTDPTVQFVPLGSLAD